MTALPCLPDCGSRSHHMLAVVPPAWWLVTGMVPQAAYAGPRRVTTKFVPRPMALAWRKTWLCWDSWSILPWCGRPGQPHRLYTDILWEDVFRDAQREDAPVAVVHTAYPDFGMDFGLVPAWCSPFLLDLHAALRPAGQFPTSARRRCVWLPVAWPGFRKASGAAGRLVVHAVVGLSLPVQCGAPSLLVPCRLVQQAVILDKMRSMLVLCWCAFVTCPRAGLLRPKGLRLWRDVRFQFCHFDRPASLGC